MSGLPCVPSQDRDLEARTREIQASRALYGWTHELIPGAGMSSIVLEQDRPSGTWARRHLWAIAKVRFNNAVHRLRWGRASGRPRHLDDYKRLFTTIRLPERSRQFVGDATFAWLRVGGLNPVVIARAEELPDHFPVTTGHLRAAPGFEEDDLVAAGREGRLYLADYEPLAARGPAEAPDPGKFSHAPLALFALPRDRRSLAPIAIQLGQVPGPDNPLVTPADGVAWRIARSLLEVADVGHHQPLSHGLTHLVAEVFAVCSRRQLSRRHPVSALLEPHIEGTIYINNMATWGLLQEGSMVDDIMSGSITAIKRLAGENVTGRSFQDMMPPRALRLRGVDDPALLPDYPYRDDALALWKALREWISAYVRLYYRDDGEVAADPELRGFFRDATSPEGGRLKDVGENGQVVTRDVLADVLATAVFMASIQHSALNTPQGWLCYAPAFPMAAYRPAPRAGGPLTEQDWLDVLPPLEQAQQQLEFGYRISSTQYGQLGRYATSAFADPRLEAPLRRFQSRLEDIEAGIQARNREASLPYEFLLPSRISQSVNV